MKADPPLTDSELRDLEAKAVEAMKPHDGMLKCDFDFIKAASPPTVIRLVGELRRLRGAG